VAYKKHITKLLTLLTNISSARSPSQVLVGLAPLLASSILLNICRQESAPQCTGPDYTWQR
jgi:hypothetical protein